MPLASMYTTDFSGGQYDSAAPTAYPKATAAVVRNGRIQPDGTVKRRSGTIRTSAAVPNAGTGYGGVLFTTAAGTDQIIAFHGAKAYKSEDYGATFTEIATGLRQDYYDFAEIRIGASNYLFAANGDTTIKKWDGTTWGTVANAPSGVKYLEAFNRRLYASGHSGVLVQASKINDSEVWASPDGLTVQVRALPTGMSALGRHLLVFDRDSTSYIDGFGEQTLIVAAGETGLSRSVGCAAFRTIVSIGDDGVAWLSRRGVEFYSEGSRIRLLSKAVQTFLQTIDWEETYANPGRPSGAYDPIEQDLHVALSTNGARNDRILVLNMRQGVEDERRGKLAAPSIDRLQAPGAGDILFGVDANGFLTAVGGGVEAKADVNGFMTLVTDGGAGDPISEDANGFLQVVTNDTLPASLFIAPSSSIPSTLYSVGYDGFLRRHHGVGSDDMISAGTGGTAVTMTLRSKPFLFRRSRHRKRARIIHVSSIQDAAASLTVLVRGRGADSASQTLTMSAIGEAADRQRAMVYLDGDAPQVEVRTTSDTRISLIGLSAQILRERA